MLELINKNIKYLLNIENSSKREEKITINEIVLKIKKERLITISWLKWIWKTKIISYIINNSNFKDNFLYINKSLDLENKIKNEESLKEILYCFIKNFNKPKIIILEDLSLVKNIKSFISFLYKSNYKIIVIWNNISISNKPEIEINDKRKTEFKLLKKEYEYIEKLKTKDIIFEEIINSYSLKNPFLYKNTLIFLSQYNESASVREINRNLNKNIKISLVTMMEYLKYSINTKIIKQIYTFDFKKNKQINTKTKFYFTDINFRNSLYDFELNENILRENFLYNELYKSKYKISSWINWNYDFNFYWNKVIEDNENSFYKINTIFIDFCKTTDKKEVKKQINKLLKVPEIPYKPENKNYNFTQTFSKYLIIEDIEKSWIKKLHYESLKIISLNELLKLI